jgi:hypothetical protein
MSSSSSSEDMATCLRLPRAFCVDIASTLRFPLAAVLTPGGSGSRGPRVVHAGFCLLGSSVGHSSFGKNFSTT